MERNYFILELDLEGPNVNCYAPIYSDRQSNNEIVFTSSEALSDFQEVYIMDSQGGRHDLIFSLTGENEYIGNVVFNEYPMGIATVYGQFKDDVGNPSNLASRSINIVSSHDSLMLKLTVSEKEASVSINSKEASVSINSKEASVTLFEDESKTTLR